MAFDLGLADRIRSVLSQRTTFDERRMFGGLAFMVNNRMCCGVMKTNLVLRLPPEQVTEALRKPHTRIMDFTGKPMKSMIYVDAHGTDSDEALSGWVDSAVAFARLEPSPASSRRKRK